MLFCPNVARGARRPCAACLQVQEGASRWEERCKELQSQYDKVDLREHELVVKELRNAKQLITTHQQEGKELADKHEALQEEVPACLPAALLSCLPPSGPVLRPTIIIYENAC